MIPAAVDYVRAGSVEDALEALTTPDAKLLAGGQSLLPAMKLRIARPSTLVDIADLGLRGIEQRGGEIVIGALTTWDDLERADELRRPALRAIAECAAGIGDLQVRNLGTIGGSLAHADPAADMPAVLLALGATLRVTSKDGARDVPVAELALGPFTTSLGTGDLVTEVVVPAFQVGTGTAYVSVEHPASGFALAGAAALVEPSDERVALTGIGAAPFVLDGPIENAEVYGDRFASEEYRRGLARTVADRALAAARARAKEDLSWTV